MSDAIFLSASVPDPVRAPDMAATADSVAIAAAVAALVHVTLGRRPLVWGGHPAITPMILVAAESLGINYGDWVTLYQSKYFEDEFPEDNANFKNVIYTPTYKSDVAKSLYEMRVKMFSSTDFKAAVFIGGMGGVVDEFNLFQQFQPNSEVIPIASTGGASAVIAKLLKNCGDDLQRDLDYVALLYRHLNISPRERRYVARKKQPREIERRMWHKSDSGPSIG